MRRFVLLLLVPLAACTASPDALGITGPRGAQVAPQATDTGAGAVDPLMRGNRYAPTMLPTTNGGRYWGYD